MCLNLSDSTQRFTEDVRHHVPGSVGRYLTALAKPFEQPVPALQLNRLKRDKGVNVYYGGYKKHFDEVIFAIPPENGFGVDCGAVAIGAGNIESICFYKL